MAAATSSVGVIANPHAGKDIRRLVAHASPVSDVTKLGIVRRAVLGAIDGGATRIVLAPDGQALTQRACKGLDDLAEIVVLDEPVEGRSSDSTTMAMRMAKEDVGALVVLGGDGTNRDVVKGWLDPPLISISTGTNNVFPRMTEATTAGLAAGLVASGAVALHDAATQAKVIHLTFHDGTADDLAVVDLALVQGQFTGARAVWDPASIRQLLTCIAEPAAIGLSSLAGLLHPVSRASAGGVSVHFGPGRVVRAPLAPGQFVDVPFRDCAFVDDGEPVEFRGPGVLTFDGERDRVLHGDAAATATIRRDGPLVIDVERTLAVAASNHHFERS